MDGLRKVPDNVPNKDMLRGHLDKPLSAVPDPFGNEYPSFAAHNNARLRRFLDQFGFEYEFLSATERYRSGDFDATLLKMLEVYDEVMDIILPTLGPERRATYSPFLPVSPTTGKVLQVPMIERNAKKGTVTYVDPDTKEKVETPVTGGRVKAQWKADWALRWTALGVDYEMCGKDLIESVTLSSKICRALGGRPPESFIYELFLDDKGAKISKSKGNGLTIEEWLTYASPQSLSLFMYPEAEGGQAAVLRRDPEDGRRVSGLSHQVPAGGAEGEAGEPGLAHPRRASARGRAADQLRAAAEPGVGVERRGQGDAVGLHPQVRGRRDAAGAPDPRSSGRLRARLLPRLRQAGEDLSARQPSKERTAFEDLSAKLAGADPKASGEDLQNIVYEVGKTHAFEPLRAWFGALYEVLLGQSQGPRFGGFVELYGVENTRALIAKALKGELVRSKG